MKKKIWVIVLAGSLLIGAAAGVQAKQPKPDCAPMAPDAPKAPHMMGHAQGHGMAGFLIELGLDDKQILKIADLKQENLKKMLPTIREMHQLAEERATLADDPEANRDQIVKNSKRMGELRAEMQGMKIDLMSAAKKILTAEQLEKLGDRDLFGDGPGMMRDGPRPMRGMHRGQTPPRAQESPGTGMDD